MQLLPFGSAAVWQCCPLAVPQGCLWRVSQRTCAVQATSKSSGWGAARPLVRGRKPAHSTGGQHVMQLLLFDSAAGVLPAVCIKKSAVPASSQSSASGIAFDEVVQHDDQRLPATACLHAVVMLLTRCLASEERNSCPSCPTPVCVPDDLMLRAACHGGMLALLLPGKCHSPRCCSTCPCSADQVPAGAEAAFVSAHALHHVQLTLLLAFGHPARLLPTTLLLSGLLSHRSSSSGCRCTSPPLSASFKASPQHPPDGMSDPCHSRY